MRNDISAPSFRSRYIPATSLRINPIFPIRNYYIRVEHHKEIFIGNKQVNLWLSWG